MGPIQELLASNHRQALQFFIVGLQDVSEPTVDQQELPIQRQCPRTLRASIDT